jgi:Mn2+/Fe2+ NRAMP family transporter
MGPGLLYAGAAIGVSHLVQSTRAGAEYGWALVWAVLAANLLKYPFFQFGPRYATATGKSLLEGYYQLGKWAYYIFLFITIGTMFTIQAAVTLVTAGLAGNLLGIDLSANTYATLLLIICACILMIGKYNILDKTIKGVIIILSISTIVALIAGVLKYSPDQVLVERQFQWENMADFAFLIALMGWMPAPIDISVWHSLWTLEKKKAQPDVSEMDAKVDFHIGYWGTTILAVFFVALGALSIYGKGEQMPDSSLAFASKLISIYTSNIGDWSFWIISIAAFTTMFSTSITVMDAYPRTITNAINISNVASRRNKTLIYNLLVIVLISGAAIILWQLTGSMKSLIQFATVVSFLTAPILALLNYIVISGKDVPASFKPGSFEKVICLLGGIYLVVFSGYYIAKVLL